MSSCSVTGWESQGEGGLHVTEIKWFGEEVVYIWPSVLLWFYFYGAIIKILSRPAN